ncbi:hypothetical protein DEU56DRAFT_911302 [Suillus clintonianus]|uniref:uncharacterized protein n=1 Tax=Suillus clintonianus TaxID=1904413 RepID=UPI001B85E42A|nr:uncharacterized protein DEU56DRAFT_911302 [Suillus clintonianus]KAG2141968.1 hypothetical protein DEU56DRAFT_911302 [Suillus clintonianus]
MPQRAPHHIVPSDRSELDSDDLDSPSVAVDIASTASQPSVSNSRGQQQHGDIEIVRHLQLENQMLKNDNRTLGEKNKTLLSNQHQRSSAQVLDELKAFDVELSTFSHKYGVVAEVFPSEHRILKLVVPNPPPAILSGSCYASKSAEELGLVTELYSLLPDHLHRFVPTSHFQSLLEQQLQGGRSSEIGKLRVMAGRIFSLDPSYFDTGFMNRDTIPEIQKMLGTTGSRSSSSKFPPVIFTRQERDPTMSTVFGNWEPVAKAIRVIMFGKNSLDIAGWPRAKCNARKWGITSCTPVAPNSPTLALAAPPAVSDAVPAPPTIPIAMPVPPAVPVAVPAPPAVPIAVQAPAITPAAETIITLGPLPAIPVSLAADESPPVPDGPNNMEILPTAAPSSS